MHKQQPWQETNPVSKIYVRRSVPRTPAKAPSVPIPVASYPLPQHLGRRKRVDQCALRDVADWNELVRPMGHRQQSRSVGKRGYAASRIESCFEQTWAHLKGGFPSGHAANVT